MLESLHRRLSMVIALGLMLDIIFPWTHPNGLAETTTMVVRTLVMRTNLLISAWGDIACSYANSSMTHCHSIYLCVTASDWVPVLYFRIFECAIYVPIAPPQCSMMGPYKRMGNYVGFETPTIVRHLMPLLGDLLTARFADVTLRRQSSSR